MRRIFSVVVLSSALLVLGSSSAGAGNGNGLPPHKDKDVCAKANGPDAAACDSRVVTETDGVTPLATPMYSNGYAPADLQSAYKLTGGPSSMVAIVDAYANPNAESDLAAYRAQFGLPACTSGTGCF